MGITRLEIAKTKIDSTHSTVFVDTSTSILNQLIEMLLLFQPKPITNLPSIESHIPSAVATSNIPRNPSLNAKSTLKTPAREQRAYVTPEYIIPFRIHPRSLLYHLYLVQ